jgi:hypothetical protein
MNITKKIASGVAAAALLLNTALPILAETTLEITGNGDSALSTINVESEQSTGVIQDNDAFVANEITVMANTGANDASRNTGGEVTVDTGDAEVDVAVSNMVNSNQAEVECCDTGDVDALIKGNGTDSDNHITLTLNDDDDGKDGEANIGVVQTNNADVHNGVTVMANTGENSAGRNTGGDVEIKTGDVKANDGISISNTLNSNSAYVGGGGGAGALSARIVGNGENSLNTIDLEQENAVLVTQLNDAFVANQVGLIANTGNNWAGRNTGGNVLIDTGKVDVDVTFDTKANFNWADVDCGCLFGGLVAEIKKNGTDTHNHITADTDSETFTVQSNYARSGAFLNMASLAGNTGDNSAGRNTGDSLGDPAIYTGNAIIDVEVMNSGNSNVLGDGPGGCFPTPEWPGGCGGHNGQTSYFGSFWAAFLAWVGYYEA